VTKASVRGPFTGCVACQRILKEGGTITGLTAVKDRVIAVIGRFPGPLNATKTLPVASPSAVQATSDDAPYLQLVGKIAVTGQATTATGDSVDVYGSGFCGTTGCSPVTIRVDKRVAADDVRVDEKGGFKATVKVIEMPGHYGVSATQKTDKGIELHDERVLVVPVIDKD
jgi:hypothetical protein